MKKTFSNKKSAFSLIELSIVLIIIGLLISGITGGASLIKSSELRSVISEARAYATSVNGFHSQFNAYPGDYNVALGSQGTYVGDADGTIEFTSVHTTVVGNESAMAWYMLTQIGSVAGSYTAAAATTSQVPGTHMPASKIRAAGWLFDYISSQNVAVLTGATVTTGIGTGSTLANFSSGVITPVDALSIDTKVDDGVANAGKVRGLLAACFSTTTYTVATTTKTCALSYQVDINS